MKVGDAVSPTIALKSVTVTVFVVVDSSQSDDELPSDGPKIAIDKISSEALPYVYSTPIIEVVV